MQKSVYSKYGSMYSNKRCTAEPGVEKKNERAKRTLHVNQVQNEPGM